MSGRKKKPTALRILEGNPGHRPINHDEPIPKKRAKGKAPDHIIDPIARDAWTEISNELNLLKITGSTDEKALEVLCELYARFRRMCNSALTKKGNLKANAPDVTKVSRELRAMFAEFGMTPASRTRIKVEKPEENKGKFEEFFRSADKTG